MFEKIRRKDREIEIKESIEILNKYSKEYTEKGREYIKNVTVFLGYKNFP